MADSEKTRVQTVTENIENTESRYGTDSFELIKIQCLKDISVSLAMLVDTGSSSSAASSGS